MRLVAFDTSGPHVAVAVLTPEGLTSAVEELSRGQGERLLPLCEELLAETRVDWHELDALGVGIGPGNFTGIRISVAAARGLALGLKVPAIGVSLFDTTQKLGNWAQTAVPAPRDQAYFLDPNKMDAPILTKATSVQTAKFSSEFATEQHVRAIAEIAVERVYKNTSPPAPLYVKPADAAPPRDAPPILID
ncbi:MAG: tRNA (adenosine(37)-N6)-threonylcarbamoyltransferase complex dimerization subunit type 1 TsaB [Pseudomonadota bacterium]